MSELRDKIAGEIRDALIAGCTDREDFPERLAALILTIPDLASALLLMNTAQRRFGEAVRQADPTEMMLSGFQNAHPWANLLKSEDLPPSPHQVSQPVTPP